MRRTTALLIAMGLTLSACAAGGEASTETMQASGEGAVMQPEEAALDSEITSDDGSMTLDLEVATDRKVIRQASLELHAANTRAAYEHIIDLVESTGGFLADANVLPTTGGDEQPQISMTVRIPADRLNATMSAIKESVDEVVSETQGAKDVTAEYVDLEARLTNLKALEVELRALLEEVRKQENADPEKLLRVFNEISDVRGQIEQIQGQINYLSDKTSLATLDMAITQTPSAVPIVDEPWRPAEVAKDAVRQLVDGLQGVADTVIGFSLYALPMLLITLGPLALIGLFVYRRFFRRTPPAPASS
jgi:uncharacterized protein (DUF342 family)